MPVVVQYCFHCSFDRLAVGDIARIPMSDMAVGANLLDDLVQLILAAREHDDHRSFSRCGLGAGPADTGGPAGDDDVTSEQRTAWVVSAVAFGVEILHPVLPQAVGVRPQRRRCDGAALQCFLCRCGLEDGRQSQMIEHHRRHAQIAKRSVTLFPNRCGCG